VNQQNQHRQTGFPFYEADGLVSNMGACEVVDFELTIQGKQAPYRTSARYRHAAAEGEFAHDSAQAAWRNLLRSLSRSIYTPDAAAIVAAGGLLYQGLMCDQVRDLWIRARSDLEQMQVAGVRLRLAIHPQAVALLPWEALYDPDRNVAFAANTHTPLVRSEPRYRFVGPARNLRVTLPLKVLIAAPELPDHELASEQEIAGVTEALAAIGPAGGAGAGALAVDVLRGRFGVTELRRRLQTVQADVLHFIGHGAPDGLWMWQRNQPAMVSAAALRATLDRVRSVKLALLNSCLAGRGTGATGFGGVAAQLLQAGLPAVIAMQLEIRDDAAVDFAHFLYEELVAGPCPGAIDLAVAAARSSLYALAPGDFSYGTPVLWLNGTDGRIFALGDRGSEFVAGVDGVVSNAGPALETEAAWLAQVALNDLTRLPSEVAFLRSKRLHLLEELHDLLQQMAALPIGCDMYAGKMMAYRRYKAALLRVERLIDEASGSRSYP
jgi:hypothetical protein